MQRMHLPKYKTHNMPPNTAAMLYTVTARMWTMKTCGAFHDKVMSEKKKICVTFWVSINTKWSGLSMT